MLGPRHVLDYPAPPRTTPAPPAAPRGSGSDSSLPIGGRGGSASGWRGGAQPRPPRLAPPPRASSGAESAAWPRYRRRGRPPQSEPSSPSVPSSPPPCAPSSPPSPPSRPVRRPASVRRVQCHTVRRQPLAAPALPQPHPTRCGERSMPDAHRWKLFSVSVNIPLFRCIFERLALARECDKAA